ncbi:MAG: hypothetical protein AUH43_06500 [Acidobacteria bacterium 13_1_40CM_65_14]|nr:MAG: hypothetical protein AUH43_06500 [Acidobacteria bacterium 13_1_40CM_65_14]OLD12459.1 MAG: hypothetical protein AUJ01_16220 [Acidobacteria bacterium 13_1_40CM_3_65_5]
MPLARADLESLLRTHCLDRTLTTALPPLDPAGMPDEYVCAPTGHTALDARLSGGFPRGQLSEIVGPRSSGRTSLLLQMLAAATARGELVALVDALDMLDVASAEAAGVQLDRLLWVRGHVVCNPGLCRDLNQRAVEQAIRAFTLVLQAGNFGIVAFDVGEAPMDAIRRLPFTTWMRLQRLIEGSQQTAGVLVGSESMARSSAGLTLRLTRAEGLGLRATPRLFDGLDMEARVIRARWRSCEATLRRSVLDTCEDSACGPSERGWGPESQGNVPSASARDSLEPLRGANAPSNCDGGGVPGAIRKGGAPRGVDDVRVPLSTICA